MIQARLVRRIYPTDFSFIEKSENSTAEIQDIVFCPAELPVENPEGSTFVSCCCERGENTSGWGKVGWSQSPVLLASPML